MSSCILSLVSPVLRTMVCGKFRESIRKEISLDDVEAEKLLKLLRLACGKEGLVAKNVEELLELGELAERLQIEAVRAVIEDKLSQELKAENCLEMIQGSEGSGLECFRNKCYRMMWDSFEVISQKEGFVKLSTQTIEDLLEADELCVDREEQVFEALLRWITDNVEGMRGEGLLRKIRYGLMSNEYLASLMSLTLPPGLGMLKDLVREALAKKAGKTGEGMCDGVERLCDKWNVARMRDRIIGANVLKSPEYVAVVGQGQIVVSDSRLHEIIVFNRDGSVARRMGSFGEAAGQFNRPKGVAVDRQGCIIVADFNNSRIQVLNGVGSVARCFGTQGSEVGQLYRPYGLAIDREGHIVVADHWNHRIQVFDADGCIVRHFGSAGAEIGQLDRPTGVAVDGAGRIVVADLGNHRVQVFNSDGSVALCFGSEGDGPGQLKYPYGVAADSGGRLVITDCFNDRVQVFNSDGSVARVMGSAGDALGQLRHLGGVVVDGTGRIIVAEGSRYGCDLNNHRVQWL